MPLVLAVIVILILVAIFTYRKTRKKSAELSKTNLLRPDEQIKLTLHQVSIRRCLNPHERSSLDLDIPVRQPDPTYSYKEIVVTDKRILGTSGRSLRVNKTIGPLGFQTDFLVYDHQMTETLEKEMAVAPQINQQPKKTSLSARLFGGYKATDLSHGTIPWWYEIKDAQFQPRTGGLFGRSTPFLSLTIQLVMHPELQTKLNSPKGPYQKLMHPLSKLTWWQLSRSSTIVHGTLEIRTKKEFEDELSQLGELLETALQPNSVKP